MTQNIFWLVVSTHLKNVRQIGSFPQVGMKIKNIWNHHPVFFGGAQELHCWKNAGGFVVFPPWNVCSEWIRLKISRIPTENFIKRFPIHFQVLAFAVRFRVGRRPCSFSKWVNCVKLIFLWSMHDWIFKHSRTVSLFIVIYRSEKRWCISLTMENQSFWCLQGNTGFPMAMLVYQGVWPVFSQANTNDHTNICIHMWNRYVSWNKWPVFACVYSVNISIYWDASEWVSETSPKNHRMKHESKIPEAWEHTNIQTSRIIPVGKWLGSTPIYKPWSSPIWKGE